MRRQRGRLPVQALGYVNPTKVILGLPETAGVHFLLRPHRYILKVITQFRNGGPRANTSMEASFYGYTREKWYSWMDKSEVYIFSQLVGNKMAHADGRKCSSEWSTRTTKRSGWTSVIKVVAAIGCPLIFSWYEVIITNSRYALVGYFITSYPTRAHGIIVICHISGNSLCFTKRTVFGIVMLVDFVGDVVVVVVVVLFMLMLLFLLWFW